MKISREEVEHVARLARLNLNEDELVKMTDQLDNILSYVDKLGELDTENVRETTHAFSISNAFREDKVKVSLDQADALKNAPAEDGESFVVPRVI